MPSRVSERFRALFPPDLRGLDFLAVVFLPPPLRPPDFFAADPRREDFLAADFFRVALRPPDFFAALRFLPAFRADFFRPPFLAAIGISPH